MLRILALAALLSVVPVAAASASTTYTGGGVTIPDVGTGSPYPSEITVNGYAGSVDKVTVTLTDVTHPHPDELQILLVSPAGEKVLIFSADGGLYDLVGVDLTFDDAAPSAVPDCAQIVSGTYRPNPDQTECHELGPFQAPAPAPPYASALSVFNGTNPNGSWKLYVQDTFATSSGSIGSWSIKLGTAFECRDTDSDGDDDDDDDALCDNWETDGLDADGDDVADLVLAGAQKDRKDLYLEVDYMAGHRPHPAAVADVVAAFAAAPVPIGLHIELDEELPHAAEINLAGCAGGANPGAADFDTIKAAAFGTAAQRAGPGLGAKAKKHSHRYAIFGHSRSNTTSSGCAETGGNDTLVTLGNFTAVGGHQVGTRDQQAGTLMHEFGHNLGFQHGGNEPVNCKPNYLSVMSYIRQFDTVPILGRPLDYSRAQLAALDETALNEPLGIGAPAGSQTAFGPEPLWVVASHGAIDWDLSGGAADPAAVADINQAISAGCGAGFSVLTGFDDWSNIVFDFQSLPSFADGVRDPGPVEITYEQAKAISPDTDGDSVVNLDENCVLVANAGQADADGDGVGDACSAVVAPTPTPTPQATNPACVDASPPESRFRRVQLDRRVLRTQGTAADVGCGSAARVDRIELALARRANGRCRFVTAKGRFKRARPCRDRLWLLRAKGTTTWKLSMRFRPRLPRGRYVLLARGVDRAGNVETKLASRSGRLR